ncbi:DapH/DapD/GlmU-related protein [Marinomonas algarum]|uniref:UDP-3-O-(3-hydroxymyristoyl)glucosamine N-acyltransferase n=1 Tax=Marinomonas algarum TaxID=2883105 RepID=A0A9X1ILN0_9GAMM|nr:DapH/DapD/GlmU-related protein [Marinomonas algarum]MCB5161520.1 hypothetical protein [Marinomonas algarum]
MSQLSSGSFFSHSIDSSSIIDFLMISYSVKVSGSVEFPLEGTCDSRKGGERKLVFSTLEHFLQIPQITESLVLIDEIPKIEDQGTNQFCQLNDPKAAFIKVLNWLVSTVGVDAHQHGFNTNKNIAESASIDATAIIQSGVEIGAGSMIGAGAIIKTGTRIGENTIIRENTVIGSDGITVYRTLEDWLVKFPHVGGVSIGDNTEIGANAVIAGGILEATHIGSNVIVGNLCNIGHGATVEDSVWISVGSLVGGHTKIGLGATIAMGVTIRDNLVIGEQASLGMGSVVVKDVESKYSMFGNPAKRMIGLKTGPKR